ncbi:DUF5681 domain-containing protein [Occallatibacter savannae]|uniref:DUF5681 domain-containing protein n=1 Tax=Occallatibacter savannae TaxID=1002691 RepID=UPI003B8394FD
MWPFVAGKSIPARELFRPRRARHLMRSQPRRSFSVHNEGFQNYDVGYGKPPQATQFTRGRSGNPKGRPKGSKNLSSVVQRECRQRVRVNGPGGPRMITKLEAAVMQIGNKAAQGELRAAKELFSLIRISEEEQGASSTGTSFQEADQRVLHTLRRRLGGLSTSESTTNSKEISE